MPRKGNRKKRGLCNRDNSRTKAYRTYAEVISKRSTVIFGKYEQDNNIENGEESIEWIVLDVRNDKVWLLSKYALDCQPFNITNQSVAWETSTLRTWLNESFALNAFSDGEFAAIVTSQVDNRESQGFYTNTVGPFGFTYDKVYLLSYWEARYYFGGDNSRLSSLCPPTQYAIARGAEVSSRDTIYGRKTGSWWLRSQGSDPRDAICIDTDGSRAACYVACDVVAIRPTIWVDLKLYDFSTGTAIKTQSLTKESAKVGGYVFFGTYEQDNNLSNGTEDIEWLVLDIQDNKALLLSKFVLDCQPFNNSDSDVSWETCTLRAWLNNDFYQNSFDPTEQAKIITTDVDNTPRQSRYPNAEISVGVGGVKYKRNFGNNTRDKVFALSYAETMKYFDSDDKRESFGTEYSRSRGVATLPTGSAAWWLRSLGEKSGYQHTAAYMFGGLDWELIVNSPECGVRPAMWVDISL